MKRRPLIIAAVVTVAALACVVPVWEDVWLWVAYEETQKSDSVTYNKRWRWLPGVHRHRFTRCPSCARGNHKTCSELTTVELELTPGKMETLDIAHCTCPTCHPERER